MKYNYYKIILQTNDQKTDIYYEHAICEKEAIILAQAEAIKEARGYVFVSIQKKEYSYHRGAYVC